MPKRVQFGDKVIEFPDGMSDAQISAALRDLEAKPESSIFDQAAAGFKDMSVTGAGGVLSGLAAIESVIGGEGKEERVKNLFDMKKRMEEYWRNENPELNVRPQGTMQGIARGAGQIPGYLSAPLAGMQVLGRGMQEGESIIDEGGSLGAAATGAGASMALNSAALALPPAFGGNLAARAGTGAGANVAQTWLDPSIQNVIRRTVGLTEKEMPAYEDYAGAAALGAGFGIASTPRVKPQDTPPPTKVVLDQADAAKKGSPFWKGGGDVIKPEPLTPGRLPPIQTEGLPPDIPPIARGEPPLPDLNTIQDHVPLLPDTPIAREGVTGETPLPTIDPRLAARDLMDTPDLPPMGLPRRDSRGDMHNMAEGMETVDFPLRQEVLERPEYQQAIDAFRRVDQDLQNKLDSLALKIEQEAKWLQDFEGKKTDKDYEKLNGLLEEQASLEQQRTANEQEFAAGMKMFGVEKASDAYGRGLYEGTDRTKQQSVRKTATMLPPEVSKVSDAVRKVGRMKKQGGALDPQVFKEGFKRLSRALSRLTDQPWLKTRFPADQYMTNSDGTPLVMLHGTKAQFDNFRTFSHGYAEAQGIHLGFTVPSHLIHKADLNTSMQTRKGKAELSNAFGDSPFADSNSVRGSNIRPVVIRNGNYPFIKSDAGNWDPTSLLKISVRDQQGAWIPFKEFFMREAKKNNTPMSDDRYGAWVGTIESTGYEDRGRMFSLMLKEAGIDGFFYRNTQEALTNRARITTERAKKYLYQPADQAAPKPKGSLQDTISFVTWDPDNVRSVYEDKPRVPKKEMGGENYTKAVVEGLEKLIAKVKKGLPKSEEGVRADVVSKAVGWRQNYIAEVPEVTPEFLEKVKNEPNSSNIISRGLAPGRVAMQELQGRTNELIAFAGRHLENARNRYEILKDEVVEPIKRVMRPVIQSKAQLESLTEVFTRELKNKARYPDDVLQQALSPKGFEAYKALRDGLDRAREIINATRKAKGLKEISMLEAYMGSMWLGPWKAHVYDSNNNLVWVLSEPSAYARSQAIDYLKTHDPSLKFTEVKYDASMGRAQDRLDAAYTDLITILGKDNLVTQTVGELLAKRYMGETLNIGGVEQHFKKKTGVGGFAGNRPWAYRFSDQQALFEQQLRYIDNVIRWGEQQKVLAKIDGVIKDPGVAETRAPDIEYIKELVKAEQGRDVYRGVSAMEDALGKWSGLSPRHYMQGLGMSKAWFYMHKLGMSLPFMVTSFVQPFLSLPPALFAQKANWGTGMFHAILDGYLMGISVLGVDVAAVGGKRMQDLAESLANHQPSELSAEAIKYARANRVVELNQLTDVMDVTMDARWEVIKKTVGASITVPEMFARSNAYMAFVHGLKHKYDTSTHEGRLALFEKAAEITKEAMGDYNPAQKAMIFQRFGMIGNAASALQTFMMNHMYQTYKYAKMAAKGDPAPFLMQTMMQLAFTGATGLIGVEDAEDILQFLKKFMPHDMYVKHKDASVKQFIADLMGKDASPFVKDAWAYGLVSTLTGLNLYSRFSTSDMLRIFPAEPSFGSSIDGFIPYITDTIKQIGAVGTLAFGSTELGRLEALNTLTPTALKGVFEESQRRGDIIPRMGQQEYGGVRRPAEEANLRRLGFKSFDEQKQMDKVYSQLGRTRGIDERIQKIRANFVEGLIARNPDEVVTAIKKAVDIGHDPSPWLSSRSVQQIYMNAYLPIAERELYALGKKKKLTPEEAKRFEAWRNIYELNR